MPPRIQRHHSQTEQSPRRATRGVMFQQVVNEEHKEEDESIDSDELDRDEEDQDIGA